MAPGIVIQVHGYAPPGATPGAAPSFLRMLQTATKYQGAVVHPFVWDSRGHLLRRGHFGEAVVRANAAAPELAELILRQCDLDPAFVDLCGFSLGCRVIHGALSRIPPGLVRDVSLFGGAFPAAFSWWRQTKQITGLLSNFFSAHDRALDLYQVPYYRRGRSIGKPGGISSRLLRVINVDAGSMVAGHNGYAAQVGRLLDELPVSAPVGPVWGDWRDEFRWDPPPKFRSTPRVANRGMKAEIVQRALTEPLDGGPPLLVTAQIDGLLESKTAAAVRSFKVRNGLADDSRVDQATWDCLVRVPAELC